MKSNHNIKALEKGFACSKNWNELDGGDLKRYCQTCSLSVHDFTNMSNDEVLKALSQQNGKKTCGRLNEGQLNQINAELTTGGNGLVKAVATAAVVVSLTACGSSKELEAEACAYSEPSVEILANNINPDSLNTVWVKGKIFGEDGEPVIGAKFFVEALQQGCVTDADGNFNLQFDKPENDSLTVLVKGLGYQSYLLSLNEVRNSEIQINLVEEEYIGEIVIIKQPLHKRIWGRMRGVFRKG